MSAKAALKVVSKDRKIVVDYAYEGETKNCWKYATGQDLAALGLTHMTRTQYLDKKHFPVAPSSVTVVVSVVEGG